VNKCLLIFFSCIIIIGTTKELYSQNKEAVFDGIPIPTDKNMMFYIQKNTNPNTVVYALNIGPDGKINPKEPIDVFWRRYEKENGIKKKLGWIEKTFAFDFKVKPLKNKANTYVFSLVAMKNKKLYVTQGKKGEPEVAMIIDGKMVRLERIFVMVDDSNKRFQSVLSMQLFGRDFKTGKLLYEKILKEDL
jgi:hypothetical protein